jgi:hypothetical protein
MLSDFQNKKETLFSAYPSWRLCVHKRTCTDWGCLAAKGTEVFRNCFHTMKRIAARKLAVSFTSGRLVRHISGKQIQKILRSWME